MRLILSPSGRLVRNAEALLDDYRKFGAGGLRYLDYKPHSGADDLFPEDLAVTLLVNSRAGRRAFTALEQHAGAARALLRDLPHDTSLENADDDTVELVVRAIHGLVMLDGFRAALATKVLHKKRPKLIPMLDSTAIFGAYMEVRWDPPNHRAESWSVRTYESIKAAILAIRTDLIRKQNAVAWVTLAQREIAAGRSRLEIFDMVWWSYFQIREGADPKTGRRLRRTTERLYRSAGAAQGRKTAPG
jgi:hypothetical protein